MGVRVTVRVKDSVGVQNGQKFLEVPLVPAERSEPSARIEAGTFDSCWPEAP